MSIPKRFILEAEERARERIEGQGWKKTLFLTLVILIGGFIFIKVLRAVNHPPPPIPVSRLSSRAEIEIQTDDTSLKKTVRFEEDETSNEVVNKLERLMEEFPDSWRDFSADLGPEDLISDITGRLTFDFYDEDHNLAVDFAPEDFFQFPNSITNDEIRFQNMIYDKKVKRGYCEEMGIEYYEFTL